MDPETHKELVEIKRDIRELRAGQDAEFHHNREKYVTLLDEAIEGDFRTAQILLEVDGFKSAAEIERKTTIPHKTCWRKLDKLLSKEVILSSDESKSGSPIYRHSRWFTKLRLEEYVKSKYIKETQEETQKEEQSADSNSTTNQNQSV